jgi:hypothetical protein
MSIASVRTARGWAFLLASVLVLSACSSAKQTQVSIVATPSPAATATATPTASPTAPPSPTPEDSASAEASPSAEVTPSAEETPTAAPTDTPVPTAASTAGAAACTGTADHQAFFKQAAAALKFDVYCAALPSAWWLQSTQYQEHNGGQLTIQYKNVKGGLISVGEGNFCAGAPACWTSVSDLGSASFGGLSGSMKLRTNAPSYAVFVDAGTTHGYQIIGQGMSQTDFAAFAAAMVKVPKS